MKMNWKFKMWLNLLPRVLMGILILILMSWSVNAGGDGGDFGSNCGGDVACNCGGVLNWLCCK